MFNRLLDDDLTSSTPKIAKAIVDAANNGRLLEGHEDHGGRRHGERPGAGRHLRRERGGLPAP